MRETLGAVHICRFDSVLDMFTQRRRGQAKPTYNEIKAAVLKIGRYSSFEASYNKETISFFTRLDRDPNVVSERAGFPWIKVKSKLPVEPSAT
jgi:hypothetical protein